MKVSKDLILREIAGEFLLVPTGAAAARFNGLITMNEIAHFLFQALQEEQTEASLLEQITGTYQIDPETARRDLQDFLQQLRELGVLMEP